MSIHPNTSCPIKFVISLTMLICCTTLHGSLSDAEVERLRQLASGSLKAPGGYDNERDAATDAIYRALAEKEYSVLGAGLHNTDRHVFHIALLSLVKVPLEERKRLLLMALVDPHLWPTPGEFESEESGGIRFMFFSAQLNTCNNLSKTFGIKVEYPDPWTSEQRIELAEKIRQHAAATAASKDTPTETLTLTPAQFTSTLSDLISRTSCSIAD